MDHLIKLIESRYEHVTMGAPAYRTELGTPYTTVALGGIKEQGDPFPMEVCSREIAEDKFPGCFWKTLPPVPGGTLVWRMHPKVAQEGEGMTIWARAVVEVQ